MGYLKVFCLVATAFAAIAYADEPGPVIHHHRPVYQDDCDSCGFNPQTNYYCDLNCAPPVLPYPGPVILQPLPPPPVYLPPAYPAPIYPAPVPTPYYVPHPGYGYPGYGYPGYRPPYWGRPGWGHRGGWGPHPMPHYRHMSASGCEVQQNNNGEFVVISNSDQVLFSDSSAHAEDNAKAMKSYYEKSNLGLCKVPAVESTRSADI